MEQYLFFTYFLFLFLDGLTEKEERIFKRDSYTPSKLRQNSVRAFFVDGLAFLQRALFSISDGAYKSVLQRITSMFFQTPSAPSEAKKSFDGGKQLVFVTITPCSVKTFRFSSKMSANFFSAAK